MSKRSIDNFIRSVIKLEFSSNEFVSLTRDQIKYMVYDSTRGHKEYDKYNKPALDIICENVIDNLSRKKFIKCIRLFNEEKRIHEYFYVRNYVPNSIKPS